MSHRRFKDALYEQFARIGHATASPRRIELLDLLGQGEKTVEALAQETATPVKSTSAHLRVLRQANLVRTRREGTFVFYRLAGDDVARFLRDLQTLGRNHLAEVQSLARDFIERRDALEPVSLKELRRRLREKTITLLDVRPEQEYAAGHIPGARSIPVSQLRRRLAEIPRGREIVAYCRGPYCVFSVEAVELLRAKGYRARRSDRGLPDWRAAGLPIETGSGTTIR
ncbi:MAG TPA: metalloregulator ArsR/SmtB family transcription factor [Gemmatimonadales bacterium]|nr:metalloregulator ArsR/SmtB family transcription factor [Gemmatimonadales bacterium]